MLSHRAKRKERVELQGAFWEFKINTTCHNVHESQNHYTETRSQIYTRKKMYIYQYKLIHAERSQDNGSLGLEWIERGMDWHMGACNILFLDLTVHFVNIYLTMICALFCII